MGRNKTTMVLVMILMNPSFIGKVVVMDAKPGRLKLSFNRFTMPEHEQQSISGIQCHMLNWTSSEEGKVEHLNEFLKGRMKNVYTDRCSKQAPCHRKRQTIRLPNQQCGVRSFPLSC
jgi:hypothetical protein